MSRTGVLLAGGVASAVTIAALATSGSAQAPGPTSLHLVDKAQ